MTQENRFKKIKDALQRELKIRKYKKEKNYEQIYLEFGSKSYSAHVPYLYKVKEIRRLKKAHNYDLIMKKYGEKEYQKYISYVIKQDVLDQTGSAYLAKKEQVKYLINKFITKDIPSALLSATKTIVTAGIVLICISPIFFNYVNTDIIQDNSIEYAQEISQYNINATNYANEIKELASKYELSDLDIIMKVMSDMWKQIDGYGEPELDIIGYYRLDIGNGVGVCRHMADDIAFKLNEINPEYNARTLCVYASDGNYETSNIERTFAESATTEEITGEPITIQNNFDYTILTGNHAVTIIDLNDQTIIIDPTNPMLGVLKNGEIKLLNPSTGEYNFTHIGNSFLLGLDTYEFEIRMLQSYLNHQPIEELIEQYGLEAQNESLNKIASLDAKKLS